MAVDVSPHDSEPSRSGGLWKQVNLPLNLRQPSTNEELPVPPLSRSKGETSLGPDPELGHGYFRFAGCSKESKRKSIQLQRFMERTNQSKYLYRAGFCKLCISISMETLESDRGYAHVSDVPKLQASSAECNLCYLLKHTLLVWARRLAHEMELTDVEEAFEVLSTHVQEDGSVSQTACPLVLSLYPSSFLRAREIYIGTRFQRRGQDLPQSSRPGTLFFHSEKEPALIKPRLRDRAHFSRIARQLRSISPDHDGFDPNHEVVLILLTRVLDLKGPKARERPLFGR